MSSHKTIDSDSSPQNLRKASSVPTIPHPRPSLNVERSRSSLSIENVKNDPDLQRAIDLVDLHYGVKMKHVQKLDTGLQKARLDVKAVEERLRSGSRSKHLKSES